MHPSILKVLAYFDLFNYPVTAGEIRFFLDRKVEETQLADALNCLVADKKLFLTEGFYSLKDDQRMIERRLKGNKHADDLLLIADRISRFLFQFPYVRGVGISGSLSKRFADEHADIDYFIITRANRLWIARTLMHLFKKWSFLTGKQHWYCMNYYIDEEALEIEEKNIFTATELITLVPACGNGELAHFFDANSWAATYFPHYHERKKDAFNIVRPSLLKRVLEKMFDNKLGDRLDDHLRRITSRRWQEKEAKGALNDKGQRMSLKTGKHYSRPNPGQFQQKILGAYTNRLIDLENQWQSNTITPFS